MTPAVVVAERQSGPPDVRVVPLRGATVDEIAPQVEALRAQANGYVTGPAGLLVDAVEVFEAIDGRLLVATSVLILVLLVLIYRSQLIALVPVIVVALAYSIAAGLLYLLVTGAGLAVNGQTTGLLIILMFARAAVPARVRHRPRRARRHVRRADARRPRHRDPARPGGPDRLLPIRPERI